MQLQVRSLKKDRQSASAAIHHRDGDEAIPVCVDLDGTLIKSDLLMESLFALLRRNPLFVFLLPIWFMKGKANIKYQITQHVDIDPSLLPYNVRLLAELRRLKTAGRRLVLATAANEKLARQVADHLGLFDRVIASGHQNNLSGTHKRDALVQAFGEAGYDYAANSRKDFPVWKSARNAIVVNASKDVTAWAQQNCNFAQIMGSPKPSLRNYAKAIRIHQWLKNILVFVPLLLSHRILEPEAVFQSVIAFLSFCLLASSTYVLNDLLDLIVDRQHPSKRERPFAAGDIPIWHGVAMIPVLLVLALLLSLLLPPQFLLVACAYYIITLAYSLRIKQMLILDTLTLAGLFTLRIFAGAAALDITVSFWLLAFSMFAFLSLAMTKRYTELLTLRDRASRRTTGRGYEEIDLDSLFQFGVTSGYLSILVLALYIDSDAVKLLYPRPEALWLLCVIGLYIISRIWLLARRDQMPDDPVVFVIQDRRTQLMAIAAAIILALAAL